MKVPKPLSALCGAAVLCGSLLLAGGGYRLITKFDLGAAPGGKEYWDYSAFDPSSRRLYISHNTEVKVVEADTGKIVGSLADLKRVHGIALVPQLGKAFISDGGADEAVVFDFKTLKIAGRIKTGGNPDSIIYSSASKHIFTMNGKTNDSTVIDPATDTIVATIPMGGRPEYAVSEGKGRKGRCIFFMKTLPTNSVSSKPLRLNSARAMRRLTPRRTASSSTRRTLALLPSPRRSNRTLSLRRSQEPSASSSTGGDPFALATHILARFFDADGSAGEDCAQVNCFVPARTSDDRTHRPFCAGTALI